MTNPTWSDLHLDYITHYGDLTSFRRATVTIDVVGKIYTLSKWYKGCGFSPETVRYSNIDTAMTAGEDWFHKGV